MKCYIWISNQALCRIVDYGEKKSSYNQIYEVLEIQLFHFITLFVEQKDLADKKKINN